jgi:peptidyl-prolyl isomerase H (cyclophilin H)
MLVVLQFFMTTVPTPWLDGKHVVFGRLMDSDSLLVLRKLENVPTGPLNRPKLECTISECGEL